MTFAHAARLAVACALLSATLPFAALADGDARVDATRTALREAARAARAEPRAAQIPRGAFLARPRAGDAQLSPDG
ncbi:MAG TPA: hypothetical protein VFO79_02255, partial [Xanthomonadales bacterium]|nr:hypothetical protein [Xanthomonadales bacterium]